MSSRSEVWGEDARGASGSAGRGAALAWTETCLERVARREGDIMAWAHLEPQDARRQAREIDSRRESGGEPGPLAGVPVGIKDIIDVAGMPGERGSAIFRGRRPERDATVTRRLRQAGAVILGKTVTAELAVYHPGPTRNPHDPGRTPGGSSSGSAAAVAAGMAALTLGTQTNGSVIRPASFCGVVGYKPSFGLIGRAGVLSVCPHLDTIGVMTRTVAQAALAGAVLMGPDPGDPWCLSQASPGLVELPPAPLGRAPRLAWIATRVWDRLEPGTRQVYQDLLDRMGPAVTPVEAPPEMDQAWDLHRTIMARELAVSLGPILDGPGGHQLSPRLVDMIQQGRELTDADRDRALDRHLELIQLFATLMVGFDAALTPAALGAAPVGLGYTGDPACCTTWSLLGAPAVTVPGLLTAEGMPLGVQVVGPTLGDGPVLAAAQWLEGALADLA